MEEYLSCEGGKRILVIEGREIPSRRETLRPGDDDLNARQSL